MAQTGNTFSDLVTGTAIGAAATDTFTEVGVVTLRPGSGGTESGRIIGLWDNGTANANAAAEAYQYQVNFDLGELGLKEYLISGACSVGEGVATQSGGFAGPAQLTPCNIPWQGNEAIRITAGHTGPAPTAGLNIQAGLFYYENPAPPREWMKLITGMPCMYPGSGGDHEANAAVTAAVTAITDLQVPSFARHICGFKATAAQDAAPRTAEDLVMSIHFTSTFPDFTPQEYPFLWKYPNLAGTLVGKGISLPTVAWPAWINTSGVSGQVTPTVNLATLVTDAHSITADLAYTKE